MRVVVDTTLKGVIERLACRIWCFPCWLPEIIYNITKHSAVTGDPGPAPGLCLTGASLGNGPWAFACLPPRLAPTPRAWQGCEVSLP